MDAYDNAVEHALERGEDPQEYLDRKTGKKEPDYSGVRIKVSCDCPPIPFRNFDYSAIDDNSFDADWDGDHYVTSCPIGHGATASEAVIDFIEQLAARDDEDPMQVLLAICKDHIDRPTCEDCGTEPCICHAHVCMECGKVLEHVCVCANPNRMDWCSSNCPRSF
jgi:hypothetical protein